MSERAMGGYLATGPLAMAWPEGTAILRCLMLWALVCGAVGLWLLLPVRRHWGRSVGGALCAAAGLLAALDLPSLGSAGPQVLFWFLTAVTLGAAIATISAQHPVYAAIWFALSLLGTSGLMLLQGAQFLGVATVVVYAGAIVVTFLFVLMLAQPSGEARYDRTSWGGLPKALAIVAAGAWIGLFTLLLGDLRQAAGQPAAAATEASTPTAPAATAATNPPTRAAALAAPGGILTESHMAALGQRLFSKHLLSVELAGTLLLVALVGAVAAALPGRPRLEEQIEEALR